MLRLNIFTALISILFIAWHTESMAQMTLVGKLSLEGAKDFKIVSESKAKKVKVTFQLINSDSSIQITEEYQSDLNAGFNNIQKRTKRDTATEFYHVDKLRKYGLPMGDYEASIKLEDWNGKVWYSKNLRIDHSPQLFKINLNQDRNDSLDLAFQPIQESQLILQYRFKSDTVDLPKSDTARTISLPEARSMSLLIDGIEWQRFSEDDTKKDLKDSVHEFKSENEESEASFLQRLYQVDELVLSSQFEYFDQPLQGTFYRYPIATHQLSGVMSIGGIPFQAEGFMLTDQDFNIDQLISPMNYFRFSYDEELWKNKPLEERDLNNLSKEITQQQYGLLRNRNKYQAEIEALKAQGVNDPDAVKFDTPDSLNAPDLKSDSTNSSLSKKEMRRLKRLQKRRQKADNKLAKLKSRQEKIEQLKTRKPGSGKGESRRDLALDSVRFGRLTPSLSKIKSVEFGNIFPSRFGYEPVYRYYPQLLGVSSEYRVTDNTNIYGLFGRTRSGPFDWADSLRVIEGGISQRFNGHQVSIIYSRITPLNGNSSGENSNIQTSGHMIEPSIELSLSKNSKLGINSSFYLPTGNFSDSSIFDKSRSTAYLLNEFGGLSIETYAEISMSKYENPLELSAQADLFRTGTRASIFVKPLRTTFMSGLVYNHSGLLSDEMQDNKNLQLEFGIQTSFRKWPNLILKYTPFAGFQTANAGSGPGVQNSIIAYRQNTNSLISIVTWHKTLKRHQLSTTASYSRISNVLVLTNNDEPVSEAVIESYSLSSSLINSKERLTLSISVFSSDSNTNAQMRTSYLRNLGKVISIGGSAAGGKQQSENYLQLTLPMIIRAHSKLTLQIEAGKYWFENQRNSNYARVSAAYILQ